MTNITNKIASTHLGQKSIGSLKYEPNLLVAIPRVENRRQYNIQNNALPFWGYDVWNCYEFSTMTNNNFPITRLLKIKYSADSEFLIESKSLKLYLNSFNMSTFGDDVENSLLICKKLIEKDLSEKLCCEVSANFISPDVLSNNIFKEFKNILKLVDIKNLKIEKFSEAPELIKIENKPSTLFLMFDSLRSNCRVTHQPDFGDVFIYYKSQKHILEDSLIKYLCSFRQEYHFHEECVEMIYKRLSDILDNQDELMVCALYTRRGGIDINPIRMSKNCSIESYMELVDLNKIVHCTNKQ